MFFNYLKAAFRNIKKYPGFSTINIIGLAIGIASFVLISFYVNYERNYESSHRNADHIFRLSLDMYNGAEFIVTDVETYQLLGPEFNEKFPEVLNYVRMMHWDRSPIRMNDETHYEVGIYFADSSVFDVFTYEIIAGDPESSFMKPFKAVISEKLANKYFGRVEVIGEVLYLNTLENPFEIVGVMQNLPKNTHLKYDILLSHETIPKVWEQYLEYPWGGNNEYTYLLMQPGTDVNAFNKKLVQYCEDNENIEDEIVQAEHMTDIHLYSNKTFEPEVNGSAQTVNFLELVAFAILIIAWFNYINLSTSRALNRAKEVGIRKVVGSTRYQLIRQFLMESLLINVIAGLVAFTIIQLGMPFFTSITELPFPSGFIVDQFIILLLVLLVGIGTLLSGFYPAFLLSGYQPSSVLKGKFANSKSGNLLRKTLVVIQFSATVVLVVSSMAAYLQLDYMQNQDLGMEIDNRLVLKRPHLQNNDSIYAQQFSGFSKKLMSSSYIKKVSQANTVPGAELHELSTNTGLTRWPQNDRQPRNNYYIYGVDSEFLDVMRFTLLEGRNFQYSDPEYETVIINERAVETLGFSSIEEAVGQYLTYGGDSKLQVIGVVSNFHQRSPKEVYLPMVFRYKKYSDNLVLELATNNTATALSAIQTEFENQFPGSSFDYFFLDDQYNQQYQNDQTFASVSLTFTLLSIIIAILGLFGLTNFTISQRMKEIGVRKILGASAANLMRLLSQDFLQLILIAGVIAIPIAWYLVDLWLQNYANHIDLSWWMFVLPLILIMAIAIGSVLRQLILSITTNPIDSLKSE